MIKRKELTLLRSDDERFSSFTLLAFASFPPYPACPQEGENAREINCRTIDEYCHFILHPVSDFKDFRSCHPGFLLDECIQPFQGVLDVVLSQ
jgi:hypothetical protein